LNIVRLGTPRIPNAARLAKPLNRQNEHCDQGRRPKSPKAEKDKELFDNVVPLFHPSQEARGPCEKRENQALFEKPANPYEKFYKYYHEKKNAEY